MSALPLVSSEEVYSPRSSFLSSASESSESSDVRIGVIGNVDSGKSTLVGVLVGGEFDDGRGSARSKVFRFKHEQENGRTSSVSHHIVGFDDLGNSVYQTANANAAPAAKNKSWQRIVDSSRSIVTFIDLCGHEKYLKTTIAGLTGSCPHYAEVLIGGNMGVSKMTKEHIGVSLALEIPFFVVVTKVDLAPEKVLKTTIKQLFKILKHPSAGKLPVIVKSEEDVNTCFGSCHSGILQSRICPIFLVSSVKGTNIPLLRMFLSRLRAPNPLSVSRSSISSCSETENHDFTEVLHDKLPIMQIDETFMVSGVGTVLSGVVIHGMLLPGSTMLLGPFSDGDFKSCVVRSIHVKRTAVDKVNLGTSCAVAIRGNKSLKREQIRRGMVLAHPQLEPKPVYGFESDILILHHPTTLKTNYQCVIHCGATRQAASMEMAEDKALRTGDKAVVQFSFLYWPEFVRVGDTIIFREGSTKGVGKVKRLITEKKLPSKQSLNDA